MNQIYLCAQIQYRFIRMRRSVITDNFSRAQKVVHNLRIFICVVVVVIVVYGADEHFSSFTDLFYFGCFILFWLYLHCKCNLGDVSKCVF